MPLDQKRNLVEPNNPLLSITEQCALLQLNRSSYYYQGKPKVGEEDILIMHQIDRIYTKRPFYGGRRIAIQLRKDGYPVNRKRARRLMKVMGIQAIYPLPNLSRPDSDHRVYPYLLREARVIRPNQVWGTDITYIRLRNDWLYLVAIMDWYSRYVLSWELSDSLEAEFCLEALNRALTFAVPEIHNSDQGIQFTSEGYLGILEGHPDIRISMDGRGRAFDNIFNERLWRTVKYEEVYLKEYQSPKEARSSLKEYFEFYNYERFHSSLDNKTPAEVYFR